MDAPQFVPADFSTAYTLEELALLAEQLADSCRLVNLMHGPETPFSHRPLSVFSSVLWAADKMEQKINPGGVVRDGIRDGRVHAFLVHHSYSQGNYQLAVAAIQCIITAQDQILCALKLRDIVPVTAENRDRIHDRVKMSFFAFTSSIETRVIDTLAESARIIRNVAAVLNDDGNGGPVIPDERETIYLRRPAANRNAYWYSLAENFGLDKKGRDPHVLDTWNALSDDDRAQYAPKNSRLDVSPGKRKKATELVRKTIENEITRRKKLSEN